MSLTVFSSLARALVSLALYPGMLTNCAISGDILPRGAFTARTVGMTAV